MRTYTVTAFLVIALLLAACQSTTPMPTPPPPSETPLPPATLAPTTTATAVPTATAVNSMYITAFCTIIGKDQKTYVPHGTAIIIIWGWEAKTEAQINDHLQNNITTITLDGKMIEGKMDDMIKNHRNMFEVVWRSEVGILEQGQHTVTYDVKWKKMIDDGMNTYGPGGKIETVQDKCLIIVE